MLPERVSTTEAILLSGWELRAGLPFSTTEQTLFPDFTSLFFFAKRQSSCSGCIKLASIVCNISSCGRISNFFNMICRVLIKFNQNSNKNQAFKEHMLLTIKILIIIKDQLFSILKLIDNIHLQILNLL